MKAYLQPLFQVAPYLALASLGVSGLIDTTTMVILTAVLLTGRGARPPCLAKGARA